MGSRFAEGSSAVEIAGTGSAVGVEVGLFGVEVGASVGVVRTSMAISEGFGVIVGS